MRCAATPDQVSRRLASTSAVPSHLFPLPLAMADLIILNACAGRQARHCTSVLPARCTACKGTGAPQPAITGAHLPRLVRGREDGAVVALACVPSTQGGAHALRTLRLARPFITDGVSFSPRAHLPGRGSAGRSPTRRPRPRCCCPPRAARSRGGAPAAPALQAARQSRAQPPCVSRARAPSAPRWQSTSGHGRTLAGDTRAHPSQRCHPACR